MGRVITEVAYWQRKFPSLEPDTDEADMLARLLTYSRFGNDFQNIKLSRLSLSPWFSALSLLSTLSRTT